MKRQMITLRSAFKKTFARGQDAVVGVSVALAAFALFVLVPVWTTPGNDVLFQLSLLTPATLATMIVLAAANAVLISMHLYLRRTKAKTGTKEAVGGFALLGSSVVATLGCASCYSSLLSGFGLGGVIFFGKYGVYLSAAIVVISFYAVWMTAKRVEGSCAICVN